MIFFLRSMLFFLFSRHSFCINVSCRSLVLYCFGRVSTDKYAAVYTGTFTLADYNNYCVQSMSFEFIHPRSESVVGVFMLELRKRHPHFISFVDMRITGIFVVVGCFNGR